MGLSCQEVSIVMGTLHRGCRFFIEKLRNTEVKMPKLTKIKT